MNMFNHIAICVNDLKKAKLFYEKILGMENAYNFTIDNKLAKTLFNEEESINVSVYSKDNLKIEVFVTKEISPSKYSHICINVNNLEYILSQCKKYNVKIIIGHSRGKKIVFINDFSGNLYELKNMGTNNEN